ncbi:hypothetical protein GMOD_00007681 [Pyrenophora seminiperda CCB06]|uniref:Uncharacterized protein n=1 Tax=Pyrenophora seminiperda CCB06 TaxID=1302712 RepID=A0A3M7MDR8_9PLEO|nr:hypothetical protein GMOD_00007681 [Pyrenophora seminiperda CCB06]
MAASKGGSDKFTDLYSAKARLAITGRNQYTTLPRRRRIQNGEYASCFTTSSLMTITEV